jgi:hypothetical protein
LVRQRGSVSLLELPCTRFNHDRDQAGR